MQATVAEALRGLPPFAGPPVRLDFREELRARSGRLVRRPPGVEVHAAAMLRRRRIWLESALLGNLRELRRILIHELFHFVWLKLGNTLRREWEELLRQEILAGARGELGHSAAWRKDSLGRSAVRARSPRWRQYVCESFCDSAAWWFLRPAPHEEFTLDRRWRARRGRWLARLMERPALPL